MKRLPLAVCALLLVFTGCDADEGTAPTLPLTDAGASATGNYALTTTLDLPASLVAPQQAADAFATLQGLRKDPARTLFDLAEQAGVPHAQTLHQALPDILQSRLDGWINAFVTHAVFEGRPVNGELDALIAAGARLQLQVDLLSDLSLSAPDPGGTCAATHTVRALRLTALPDQGAITIPALPAPIASGATEARLAVRLSAPRAHGDALVTAGDHAFGLPIGQYMVAALDASLRQRYGADLRGLLGSMIDCRAMATSVARECLGPACVGHESELESVCGSGLDELADQVRQRLLEHDFKALHFASGTADFTAPDRLDGGVWKVSVNMGTGERGVAGRFTGARR
jgi:hypothetical protein